MRVLVVGASRGSGVAAVEALAEAGHVVTAFARSVRADPSDRRGVRHVAGDVMDDEALDTAMAGQDAVVVTLGISDNPVAVRLLRRAGTPLDVRSAGTGRVVAAMQRHGVRRLVVQTTYGIGDSFGRLSPGLKMFFRLVLQPQIADSARQEALVRASDLSWTLVRPVVLTDDDVTAPPSVSTTDEVAGWKVSRQQVAGVVAGVLADASAGGRTLSVSAA